MDELVDERFRIKRSILVVDDESDSRELLGNMLDEEYDVSFVTDGDNAMDYMNEHKDQISLVLLELLMPGKDGYQIMEEMKEDKILSHIPVIVLTSERSAEVKSLRMGAVDFIPKPYDMPEVIRARVNRSIELSENSSIIKATQSDSVTGLLHRDYFYEYVHFLDNHNPDGKMDAAVINIKRFHLINDMYGRDFGNEFLKTIAEKLREVAISGHGIACRNDADTFFLYMESGRNPEEILDTISEKAASLLENARTRLRIGMYQNVDIKLEPARRFDHALMACNGLRKTYNSQIAYYDEAMHKEETFSARLISDIDKALAEKQFMVYYQAKFAIQGETALLNSAEALVRWKHPELGMVKPDQFIPLFEGNGLVQKLDHFVWKESAAQIKAWKDTYDIIIPISVNVSRIDMLEPDFIDLLQAVVKDNGLEPEDLLLEVTESAYTENSEKIVEIVNKVRELGYKVEMDDFGSGYSSLNMLSSLPIDALKLDMGFIRNIHHNEKDMKMVELMIDIADFLSVPVIAEGVEEEEQYKLLKDVGVDLIQGYYFSRPVPAEEFERLIKEKVHYLSEQQSA